MDPGPTSLPALCMERKCRWRMAFWPNAQHETHSITQVSSSCRPNRRVRNRVSPAGHQSPRWSRLSRSECRVLGRFATRPLGTQTPPRAAPLCRHGRQAQGNADPHGPCPSPPVDAPWTRVGWSAVGSRRRCHAPRRRHPRLCGPPPVSRRSRTLIRRPRVALALPDAPQHAADPP